MASVVRPPWMPEELFAEWLGYYSEAGGTGVTNAANLATERLRNSPNYDQYFPGLRRADGSLRYANNPEATYFNNIESFRNAVESVGLNPDVFSERYIALIEGDTSPQEFAARVNSTYDRVEMAETGSNIRTWYAENYGMDMSNQAIIASIMDPEIGQAILERRISMAEIGGEAANRNYELSKEFVGMLESEGMNRAAADRIFGSADRMLPLLNRLAQRHGDPDDDFSLEEFVEGAFSADAEQLDRMTRLGSQETAQFSANDQIGIQRSQRGLGVTGLDVS